MSTNSLSHRNVEPVSLPRGEFYLVRIKEGGKYRDVVWAGKLLPCLTDPPHYAVCFKCDADYLNMRLNIHRLENIPLREIASAIMCQYHTNEWEIIHDYPPAYVPQGWDSVDTSVGTSVDATA